MTSISQHRPYGVVIGLMTATILCLHFLVDVSLVDKPGIRLCLPLQVGEWSGDELLYCHQPECSDNFATKAADKICPRCGAALFPMSKIEKDVLPADTVFLKGRYTRPQGDTLFVSIVLSGQDVGSIHRPQVCLVGQGFRIVQSHRIEVPMKNRPPLSIMMLDLMPAYSPGNSPEPRGWNGVFAYWFVGQGRETPYHLQRMAWLYWDRLAHGVAHKWAYIGIIAGGASTEKQAACIREFVAAFYPNITL